MNRILTLVTLVALSLACDRNSCDLDACDLDGDGDGGTEADYKAFQNASAVAAEIPATLRLRTWTETARSPSPTSAPTRSAARSAELEIPMTLRSFRYSHLAVALVAFIASTITYAQVAEAPPAASPIDLGTIGALLGAVAAALLGLWAVGRDLINRMAARPTVDAWDRAKAVTDKLEPWAETLAKIADPKDLMVAPTPTNPTGHA